VDANGSSLVCAEEAQGVDLVISFPPAGGWMTGCDG
jgi:hypothetical protein